VTLKLIGAGFGRTGTMSLRDALDIIGFGPCYHMSEVIAHQHYHFWARLGRGERIEWEQIFENYQAVVDWPASTYWRELAEAYPHAKVLLTVRDPDKWFASCRNTIMSDAHRNRFHEENSDPDRRAMADVLYEKTFHGRYGDRDHAIAVFNAHNEEVKRTIPEERLLIYEAGQGWGPLCQFLGVAIPDVPFPLTNTTEEWLTRPHKSNIGSPDIRQRDS
jgi:hypothetical protein